MKTTIHNLRKVVMLCVTLAIMGLTLGSCASDIDDSLSSTPDKESGQTKYPTTTIRMYIGDMQMDGEFTNWQVMPRHTVSSPVPSRSTTTARWRTDKTSSPPATSWTSAHSNSANSHTSGRPSAAITTTYSSTTPTVRENCKTSPWHGYSAVPPTTSLATAVKCAP